MSEIFLNLHWNLYFGFILCPMTMSALRGDNNANNNYYIKKKEGTKGTMCRKLRYGSGSASDHMCLWEQRVTEGRDEQCKHTNQRAWVGDKAPLCT